MLTWFQIGRLCFDHHQIGQSTLWMNIPRTREDFDSFWAGWWSKV